jgi:diguanylate cyclase (GGDEF)-like protein
MIFNKTSTLVARPASGSARNLTRAACPLPVDPTHAPTEINDLLDAGSVLQMVKHLTSQNNVTDLIGALNGLLPTVFSDANLTVYELRVTRSEYSKLQCIICLDCIGEAQAIYLNDHEVMYRAYLEKQDILVDDEEAAIMFLPVILTDRTLSHLIRVQLGRHPILMDSLRDLLDIFRDVFRNLHEKAYDPLTRILNRQAFDQISSELAYGGVQTRALDPLNRNRFKAIAILDIDRFKMINDQFGHAIGDETLVLFAQTIRSVLRQEDLFFRYGGEEFVILVKDVDFEQAQNVLARCREAIESRRFPQVGKVTVSAGFADLAPTAHPLETLSKADKALYFAKQNGRNQVCSYEELLRTGLLTPVEPNRGSVDFWD